VEKFALGDGRTLVVQEGDLTRAGVDAIVNAANERMLGGGGVDGAIHRAAGPELRQACERVPEVRPGVRCPTGEARITPGFDLSARHVIHTVGPVYRSPESSAPLLASAYRSSLALAEEHGLRSIAFPAISCGVYGYPLEEAADVSLGVCRAHTGALSEIHFVLFGGAALRAWIAAARRLLAG
jgi:O-acetyl-ADP-ribose deacetylase